MFRRKIWVACAFLAAAFMQACTTGGSDDEAPARRDTPAARQEPARSGPYDYAVYLENSGSLNGYLGVSGDGSFRDAVYSLITGINGFSEKRALHLNDINTVIIPVARDADASEVNTYISGLDAATFRQRSEARGGNQAKSDLRGVFKHVLDSTNGQTVSILISDCIFSPDKGNALDYLSQQKAGIQGFFQEKLEGQPFATLVLKFHSDFNGAYYFQDNSSQTGSFRSRPYYITCIGPEEALQGLYRYVENKFGPKGFRDFLFFTPRKGYDVRPAIVMNTTYYNYEPDKPMIISGPQKGGPDNRFLIHIKTDFSELPVSEAYLLDPAHYEISPGYEVVRIQSLRGEGGTFTHQVTLASDKPKAEVLRLGLNNTLPPWVAATNVDTDKGLSPEALEGKTFGIRYLAGGIYDAYYAREPKPQYFNFAITVKN